MLCIPVYTPPFLLQLHSSVFGVISTNTHRIQLWFSMWKTTWKK